MATQGKIKTLYSDINSEEALFPRTKTNAVSDQNGVGLDAILDKAVYTKSVNDNELNAAPVNADTLNGNNADYFASKSYVAVEIAKAKLEGEDVDIDLSGYATKDDLNNLATKDEVKAIDFPVDSVNGKAGAVTLNAADVSAVPTTRTVNGKALSSNISLSASDVGAASSSHTHNYLPLSGGTVTGDINIKKNDIDAALSNNNVSSTQWPTSFHIVDKNSRTLARNEAIVNANGDIGSYWYVRNYNTSGSQVAQKGIKMNMNKSGAFTANVEGDLTINGAKIGLQAYPVGSIYIAYDSTSPASRFGGTWTQIKDRFLLGVGSTYAAAKTGGAATHTLSTNEIPSHQHCISINLGATGFGTHYYSPGTTNNTGTVRTDWLYYTQTDGGNGKAHDNMPPYQTVYMWRRTA